MNTGSESNPSNLHRFLMAQENSYANALSEIRAGKKRTHWIWYIFPQLKGLGTSTMADFYGIEGKAEAIKYLQHRILGKRLVEITAELLLLESNDARSIMGEPDDLKLRSCMTLFAELPETSPVFQKALHKFFNGQKDLQTLSLLKSAPRQ